MKHLLIILIFSAWWLPSLAYANQELPELDPLKPIYQKPWGGIVIAWPAGKIIKVRIPDPVTIHQLKHQLQLQDLKHKQQMEQERQENKTRDHWYGSWLKRIGWLLLAIGFAAHFATSIPLLKSISSSISTLAGFLVIAGIGLQKTVEYDLYITLTLVAVAILFCFLARNKSLSHYHTWLKNRFKKKGQKDGSAVQ